MIEELLKFQTIVQILLFAVVFYFVLNFVRGTPAAALLKGVAFLLVVGIIGLMYIADRWDLQYIKGMVQWVLSGLFVGLIIIFAPEMRRGLTRLS